VNSDEQFNASFSHVIGMARRRGFQAAMIRVLRRMGSDVSHQELGQWLHKDKKKRIHPKFGTGIILLSAAAMAEPEWRAAASGRDDGTGLPHPNSGSGLL
jgi:hypothetical protein